MVKYSRSKPAPHWAVAHQRARMPQACACKSDQSELDYGELTSSLPTASSSMASSPRACLLRARAWRAFPELGHGELTLSSHPRARLCVSSPTVDSPCLELVSRVRSLSLLSPPLWLDNITYRQDLEIRAPSHTDYT